MAENVILYVRVSTPGQAERGYSLRQQSEALEEYAKSKGYEILETIPDEGHGGTTLDRPGLDKVRDLVEAGGVDVVLAQDADRITREPGHRAFLDDEFERYGTVLRALDDWGDDSHEGQLLKYVKGWSAKGERLKMAERTRRGRLRKAREGKIIANSCADYGFKYNEARDGYDVDEETMQVVRDIFRMLAEGESLYSIVMALDGINPPGANNRSGQWGSTYIRRHIVEDDVYKPHTYDEIRELVSADVAATLDPNNRYGIWWANRHEVKTVRESTSDGNGGKQYKRRHDRRERPRGKWIAVPVPDAGIRLEHVEAARAAVKDNRRWPSKAGGREWELSGGVARCGSCGHGDLLPKNWPS
jgi:site-specific DNA recombinase